jgi:hypothetical protein
MKAVQFGIAVLLALAAFSIARGVRAPVHIDPVPEAPREQPAPVQRPVARESHLAVAFRLDPDLTQGLYLGERWVSPPTYLFAQPGTQYVVQAKAQDIDAGGEHIDVSGDWAASDPEMVAITRMEDGKVTIVVRRPGESRLTVTSLGQSKVLQVRANQLADAMQVEIDQ